MSKVLETFAFDSEAMNGFVEGGLRKWESLIILGTVWERSSMPRSRRTRG